MAKYQINIYNIETEEVEKTYSRNIIPVNLYIKFQELNERLQSEKIKNDLEMFQAMEDLFLEAFPQLTKEEYNEKTDVAEVLIAYRDIIKKATLINSKN